jgi:hypothetical protein
MVFGLINEPYEFSRLMQRILHPLKNKVAMWYLDDILVPSMSFDDMIKRLRQVLDALKSANLTLKLSKCYFGFPEVTYLGFMLSADGVRPGEQKMVAVQVSTFQGHKINRKYEDFWVYADSSEVLSHIMRN